MIALACRTWDDAGRGHQRGTPNAAYAVGLGDEVGSLEPGKRADLILLDAPSYQHLGYRFGTNLVGKVIAGGMLS